MCFIEPPSIQYAGETLNETILAGFQIQLKCKATGRPLPGESYYIPSFIRQYQIPASNSLQRYRCCSFFSHAFSAAAVTWYKDGRPLTSAAGVNILSRGQVLEIDRAQVSDAGLYKCVAINVAGNTELTYSLQVYGECV